MHPTDEFRSDVKDKNRWYAGPIRPKDEKDEKPEDYFHIAAEDWELDESLLNERTALAKVAATGYILTRAEILDIAHKAHLFCQEACGIELHPYQQDFVLRVIQSVLMEDGDEITALFARQSGKTEAVACVVVGLMVLLPRLASIPSLAADSRISKFKDGFWVGIFAPVYEQGGIMHSRMALRMGSSQMREMCRDPEINIDLKGGRALLRLHTGSYVDCNSAAPGTNIEGKTYHLVIAEEAQDIQDYKMKKSIHPMCAATLGSLVKIGTCSIHKGDFHDACKRNRSEDIRSGGDKRHLKRHFEFDYRYAARYNRRYAVYVQKEIERLGFNSDEFRMAYRLHWLVERGHWITPEILDDAGIDKRSVLKARLRGHDDLLRFVRADYPSTQDRTTPDQVASIDIGKTKDSTIVTIGKVWWENPIHIAGEDRYYVHIVNWMELVGDDHEKQYPQIKAFLKNYNLSTVIVDSTGVGDPIRSRLQADLEEFDIEVRPFVFSRKSKSLGYTLLYKEMFDQRFTYPAGKGAQRQSKWRRFMGQMGDLEKRWKGGYMVVEAPKERGSDSEGDQPHDDYPDGAMMLCYAVNHLSNRTIDQGDNPLFTRYDTAHHRREASILSSGGTNKHALFRPGSGGRRGRTF